MTKHRTGFDNGIVTLMAGELRMVAEILTSAGEERSVILLAIDEGGLKIKRDHGTWTPAIGGTR